MEKKTILALVLIFLVYWFSAKYIWKTPPANKSEAKPVAAQTENPATTPTSASLAILAPDSTASHVKIDNHIALQNNFVQLQFSNLGGVLKQVTLPLFNLADRKDPVTLIPNNQSLCNLSLLQNNQELNLLRLPMQYEMFQEGNYKGIRFFASINGNVIEKKYLLKDPYTVEMYVNLKSDKPFSGYNVFLNSGIKDTEIMTKAAAKDKLNIYKVVSQIENDLQNYPLNKIAKHPVVDGKVDWASVRSKYFMYGIMPEKRVMTTKLFMSKVNDSPAIIIGVRSDRLLTAIDDHYTLYIGPVNYKNLQTFKNGIENTAELGAKWLRFISTAFLWFITFLHKWISNYGVIIIIFAFILKLILYPLTHKSLVASQKMQKINPLMKEIQAKYKNDPVKLNQELKLLYKEHNVNPLGGCLPLLLQMPIFFALYPVLRYMIDFRQAHFVYWINDLSLPDPYWALPIIMGIFMFIQQKMMMPKAQDQAEMDERQLAALQSQKIMLYMMPAMMVFIFYSLPSGLVLYWTVFNVFSIIQQYFLMKKMK